MAIRLMDEAEFNNTMVSPMREMGEGEEINADGLTEYVTECIQVLELPTTLDDIEIERVYFSGDGRYQHILLEYGSPHIYLVIVIDAPARQIIGYHLLDLNKKYGLDAAD